MREKLSALLSGALSCLVRVWLRAISKASQRHPASRAKTTSHYFDSLQPPSRFHFLI